MNKEKDIALIAVTHSYTISPPGGVLLACSGPKQQHGRCAFDYESEECGYTLHDLHLADLFMGKPIGLYIWEGEAKYPNPDELGDFDTGEPDYIGEIRDATTDDLIHFGLLKA